MTLNDLPKIQIKHHIRATRLKLRVEPHQIRLTVPVFCTKKQIQNFIEQSESWLIETWEKQQTKIQQEQTLPNNLKLFNLDQEINIIYQTQKVCFEWNETLKTVFISDRQPERYLKAFVVEYAKVYLPLCLAEVSIKINLPFGKCSIRQPKTRWGSCSIRKDIMLNSALVLFDQKVTEYVCIHELAHTEHFDHSIKFWAEVEKHDQNYKMHQKILKSTPIPYWWY